MMSLIKLDYDGHTLHTYDKRKWIIKYLGLTFEWIEIHNTVHGGFHVRIKLKENLKPLEILAIQVLLGSDYKRETYNLLRVRNKIKNWNALFEGNERGLLIT